MSDKQLKSNMSSVPIWKIKDKRTIELRRLSFRSLERGKAID